MEEKMKVGDKVRVIKRGDRDEGVTGVVHRISKNKESVSLKLDLPEFTTVPGLMSIFKVQELEVLSSSQQTALS